MKSPQGDGDNKFWGNKQTTHDVQDLTLINSPCEENKCFQWDQKVMWTRFLLYHSLCTLEYLCNQSIFMFTM